MADRPAPYAYRCPLRWGDMDAQGHVNNAAYLDYLQEARVDFLLTGPSELSGMLASGVLVVSHQIEYLAPVEVDGQPLLIRLWVTAIGGSRFALAYELHHSGDLVARATTAAVPFDLASNTLRRLTAAERSALGAYRGPAEPLRAVPRSVPGAGAQHWALPVRWSDLDSYGHVNNVKFFDYLQEARIDLVRRGGWSLAGPLLVVRQEVDYRRPMDFRLEPYEVRTAVVAVGGRSVTLNAAIVDPRTDLVYATAATVLVVGQPISDQQRRALLAGTSGPGAHPD